MIPHDDSLLLAKEGNRRLESDCYEHWNCIKFKATVAIQHIMCVSRQIGL